MITFISKSLVSMAVLAALWGPTENWIGAQHTASLACNTDFSACRVAGKVIPLVDRTTVLGHIAEQARHDPAGQLRGEVHQIALTTFDSVRASARAGDEAQAFARVSE